MEIRTNTELGMKNINREVIKKYRPAPNYANLPGRDITAKQFQQTQKEAAALRPSQTKDIYEVTGSTVNFRA